MKKRTFGLHPSVLMEEERQESPEQQVNTCKPSQSFRDLHNCYDQKKAEKLIKEAKMQKYQRKVEAFSIMDQQRQIQPKKPKQGQKLNLPSNSSEKKRFRKKRAVQSFQTQKYYVSSVQDYGVSIMGKWMNTRQEQLEDAEPPKFKQYFGFLKGKKGENGDDDGSEKENDMENEGSQEGELRDGQEQRKQITAYYKNQNKEVDEDITVCEAPYYDLNNENQDNDNMRNGKFGKNQQRKRERYHNGRKNSKKPLFQTFQGDHGDSDEGEVLEQNIEDLEEGECLSKFVTGKLLQNRFVNQKEKQDNIIDRKIKSYFTEKPAFNPVGQKPYESKKAYLKRLQREQQKHEKMNGEKKVDNNDFLQEKNDNEEKKAEEGELDDFECMQTQKEFIPSTQPRYNHQSKYEKDTKEWMEEQVKIYVSKWEEEQAIKQKKLKEEMELEKEQAATEEEAKLIEEKNQEFWDKQEILNSNRRAALDILSKMQLGQNQLKVKVEFQNALKPAAANSIILEYYRKQALRVEKEKKLGRKVDLDEINREIEEMDQRVDVVESEAQKEERLEEFVQLQNKILNDVRKDDANTKHMMDSNEYNNLVQDDSKMSYKRLRNGMLKAPQFIQYKRKQQSRFSDQPIVKPQQIQDQQQEQQDQEQEENQENGLDDSQLDSLKALKTLKQLQYPKTKISEQVNQQLNYQKQFGNGKQNQNPYFTNNYTSNINNNNNNNNEQKKQQYQNQQIKKNPQFVSKFPGIKTQLEKKTQQEIENSHKFLQELEQEENRQLQEVDELLRKSKHQSMYDLNKNSTLRFHNNKKDGIDQNQDEQLQKFIEQQNEQTQQHTSFILDQLQLKPVFEDDNQAFKKPNRYNYDKFGNMNNNNSNINNNNSQNEYQNNLINEKVQMQYSLSNSNSTSRSQSRNSSQEKTTQQNQENKVNELFLLQQQLDQEKQEIKEIQNDESDNNSENQNSSENNNNNNDLSLKNVMQNTKQIVNSSEENTPKTPENEIDSDNNEQQNQQQSIPQISSFNVLDILNKKLDFQQNSENQNNKSNSNVQFDIDNIKEAAQYSPISPTGEQDDQENVDQNVQKMQNQIQQENNYQNGYLNKQQQQIQFNNGIKQGKLTRNQQRQLKFQQKQLLQQQQQAQQNNVYSFNLQTNLLNQDFSNQNNQTSSQKKKKGTPQQYRKQVQQQQQGNLFKQLSIKPINQQLQQQYSNEKSQEQDENNNIDNQQQQIKKESIQKEDLTQFLTKNKEEIKKLDATFLLNIKKQYESKKSVLKSMAKDDLVTKKAQDPRMKILALRNKKQDLDNNQDNNSEIQMESISQDQNDNQSQQQQEQVEEGQQQQKEYQLDLYQNINNNININNGYNVNQERQQQYDQQNQQQQQQNDLGFQIDTEPMQSEVPQNNNHNNQQRGNNRYRNQQQQQQQKQNDVEVKYQVIAQNIPLINRQNHLVNNKLASLQKEIQKQQSQPQKNELEQEQIQPQNKEDRQLQFMKQQEIIDKNKDTRYFNEDQKQQKAQKGKKCGNCNKFGHIQYNCPQYFSTGKFQNCIHCLKSHHPMDTANCTGLLCFHCYQTGHFSKQCPQQGNYRALGKCGFCKRKGHLQTQCQTLNFRRNLNSDRNKSQIQCMTCFKFGHTNCNPLPIQVNIDPIYTPKYLEQFTEQVEQIYVSNNNLKQQQLQQNTDQNDEEIDFKIRKKVKTNNINQIQQQLQQKQQQNIHNTIEIEDDNENEMINNNQEESQEFSQIQSIEEDFEELDDAQHFKITSRRIDVCDIDAQQQNSQNDIEQQNQEQELGTQEIKEIESIQQEQNQQISAIQFVQNNKINNEDDNINKHNDEDEQYQIEEEEEENKLYNINQQQKEDKDEEQLLSEI